MMRATKAVIFGCAGETLTTEEINFFGSQQPYGFILFKRNCTTPDQVRALVDQLHEAVGCEHLPILIDQEGGRVARLGPPHWRAYPAAASLAALADGALDKAKRAVFLNARLIAQDLRALGITVNCAPLADIPITGSHDIIGDRAFGKTPEQVSMLARAQANGLMAGNVVPVLKHIPGHGRAQVDSHEDLPVVTTTLEELRNTDFKPFNALNDTLMGMTAHIVYEAINKELPATLSSEAINLIRNDIGFDGLLMSDDVSMKALRGNIATLSSQIIAAGCDLVLHCNGDMAEMQQVASGIDALSVEAIRRHQHVHSVLETQINQLETERLIAEMEALLPWVYS